MAQSSNLAPFDLAQYQWQNRLILLFAPSAEDARYQEQVAALEGARAGLNDRDLLVFHLFGAGSSHVGEESLTQEEVTGLRDRFDIDPNAFTLILIGKDGTVKRRAEAVVGAQDLFDQINAMPMRRREMNAP